MATRARGARVRAEAVGDGILDAFCDALWLEDGLARNTIASYRTDLEQLAKFLKRKRLTEAGEAELFAFLAAAKGRASSAARRVSTLKRFYQYCVRERRVGADPTLKLDPPKRAPRFPRSVSEADVEALLRAPDVATSLGLRDRAMLETLYATGLRVSELVSLKIFEVNLDASRSRDRPPDSAPHPPLRSTRHSRQEALAACAAPRLCHASHQSRRRSARGATPARARRHLDHADLHACRP